MSEIIDIETAVARLLSKDNILLVCHKNPDGDTLGSAGALYHALKAKGKTVAIICNDTIVPRYDYMKLGIFDNSFEPAYVVAIDVANIQLFGDDVVDYGEKSDLCIDHHPSNGGYSDALLLESEAAATAELMYEVIKGMGVEINKTIANCLYTGLSTDTGCFKFANTTAKTHTVCAEIMNHGADFVMLNEILFESKSQGRMMIEQIALSHLEYHFGERCALMYITREEVAKAGADTTDLEGITSIPRMIEGVDVGITMRQLEGGSYKVSVRTSSGIDACKICAGLGGGGHIRASGCEFFGNLENAKEALLAEVKKHI